MGNYWITICGMKITKVPEFQADRLLELMEKRDMDPGKIEYLAGISRSMVHYLQKGAKPNVSAVIVGKLGQVLNCSVDYLLGLTDDPTQASKKELPKELRELWEVYEELPRHRRWDLLKIAVAFAEEDERAELSRQLDEQIKQRLDAAEQAGGEAASELLADLVPRLSAMIMERRAAGRSVVGGGVESKRVDEKIEDA